MAAVAPVTFIGYVPAGELSFAGHVAVGIVLKFERFSPDIKPLYEIVNVGFGLPSVFDLSSAVIVKVAFVMTPLVLVT